MLMKVEHPDIQEITTQTPTQGTAQVIQSTPTEFPSFKFPPQTPQPDYNAVDVSELSAGLGLPAMKPDPNIGASPATSHKSRITHSHPGALYGKLIGWALDKPLTAKDLAEYLQTQDSHTAAEMLVLAPTAPTASTIRLNVTTNQSPSKTRSADNDSDTFSVTPVSTETKAVPKGPSQHQHRRGSGHSSVSFRQHNRNPSYRRYPRRASRAKRSDQGPMPSAADIYPDDANWTVPRPIYEGDDYTTYKSPAVEQPQVIVDNAFNWPTPAQVYKPEPAPTAADVAAADDDVLTLMSELPEPSLNTLVSLGTSRDLNIFTGLDLPCESRALTPAQLDGSRYGMRFYSIAYGDQWELPKVNESEPFRVRPRDHDGWGGWEWALRKGCGV
ncbi:hypothetical protein N0V94_002111 [Neodidymelliopsis sp. IMI 364377]|nr:hypothetical protein N0V94_002111 [Neodidymelliopsis sp. IMI 364377]